MAANNESGNAKNVAALDELIDIIQTFGSTYNPSKNTIKLTSLQTLAVNARNANVAVNTALSNYKIAIASRETTFKTLSPLISRITNAVKATDTTTRIDEIVSSIARKIVGRRTSAKTTTQTTTTDQTPTTQTTQISSSQMSFDNRLENFDKLIKQLSSITLYTPNEPDLKIAALQSVYTDLKTKHTAAVLAATTLATARIARDEILYKDLTGLCDISVDTKNYIKSIYGITSPQYKQTAKIKIKTR